MLRDTASLGFAKTTGRQALGGLSTAPLTLAPARRPRTGGRPVAAAAPAVVAPPAARPPLAADESMLDRRIDFVERQLRAARELVTSSSEAVVYARALDDLLADGLVVAPAGEWVALTYPMTQDDDGRYWMRARRVDKRTGALTHHSVPIYTVDADGVHKRHVGDFGLLPC